MRLPLTGGGFRTELLRNSAGSIFIQAARVALGVGLAIALARSLGPTGYGAYAYVYALVTLLAIPAQFGLPALVVRETAKAEANGQWGLMYGLWRWTSFATLVLTLALAVLGGLLSLLFSDRFSTLHLDTFGWGLALVPLIALGALRGAALCGLRKVVKGQLTEQLIRPALFLALTVGISILGRGSIRADQAMALHALAAALALIIGAWLLHRARPAPVAQRPIPAYEVRRWVASAWALAMIMGLSLLNMQADIIMLGFFLSAYDVGIYRVAAQGAALVSLGLTALAAIAMPHFARFHAQNDMVQLQRLATVSARASLLLALPIALVFLIFGAQILRFVFSAEYVTGYTVLAILSLTHLVHASFGIIGPLLNMAGYERDTAKGVAIAAACNVVLNAAMIPLLGLTGAACATGITLIVWNIVLWRMVRRRLGVDSSALGLRRK